MTNNNHELNREVEFLCNSCKRYLATIIPIKFNSTIKIICKKCKNYNTFKG